MENEEKIEKELKKVQDNFNTIGDWLEDAMDAVKKLSDLEESINQQVKKDREVVSEQ